MTFINKIKMRTPNAPVRTFAANPTERVVKKMNQVSKIEKNPLGIRKMLLVLHLLE